MGNAIQSPSGYVGPALERWRSLSGPGILFLALFSIPVLILELERSELTLADQRIIDVLNVVLLIGFAGDYIIGLTKSTNRWAYVRGEWLMGILVLASVVAVTPLPGFLGGARALRLFLVLRPLITSVRLFATGGVVAKEVRYLLRRRALLTAASAAVLTWFTAAAAFTLVEDVGTSGRIETFIEALWWSAATMTTVGYGDVLPLTSEGRAIGIFTMVVGISVFGIITAGIAAWFVGVDREHDREGLPGGPAEGSA